LTVFFVFAVLSGAFDAIASPRSATLIAYEWAQL
jgi:hypothetical protein